MSASSEPAPGGGVATADGFRAFYDARAPLVYGYLLRLCGGDRAEAEDLAQEVWFALVDSIAGGHVERATPGWLLTVARTRYLDRWRKARRAARPLRVAWAASDDAADAWEPDRSDVVDHLMTLDADHRVALVLHYVDGLPVAEIAPLLQRSPAATYSLLARGRRELRARLEGASDG